jgi:MYXO-CTERM domain-containing protein
MKIPIVALALASSTASAEERPASWDMTPDELAEIGLGQTRADPIPVPPELVGERDPQAAAQAVIFVSFDAMTLIGGEDSHTNASMIYQGDVAEYGGDGTQRAALMEAVRIDWAAYNVLIVDQRPASGDYTMNVTTPTNPFGGGVLGIAPLDCNDGMKNNVTFAFHGANDGFGAPTQATTVGQEVAHSFGLEHVDEPADIMNPVNSGGDPSFMDECLALSGGGGMCADQHSANCGNATTQNSHKELLTLFGPAIPDTEAPTVTITAPVDNSMFQQGADFAIMVEAADDSAIAQVQLFNKDAALQTDLNTPYGWDVADIPPGMYVFKVVATDLSGNTADSNIVTVYVGVPPDMDTGDSGEAGSADTALDESGGGSEEGTDDGTGQDDPNGDKGCGCTQSGPSGTAFAFAFGLGLAALGFVRRRRSY